MVGKQVVDIVVAEEGNKVAVVGEDKAVALQDNQFLGLNLLAQNHLLH
jgi:hypothetical protein